MIRHTRTISRFLLASLPLFVLACLATPSVALGQPEGETEQLARASQLSRRAIQLYQRGKFAEAIPVVKKVLEIRKKALGEDHPDYATSLNNLAELYRAMGDYAKAEPLYRQALEIRKRALGEEHPDYATSRKGLAGLHELMGDYAKAEPHYRKATEIYKKALGEDHPHYATSLSHLAGLYRSMGDDAKAEPLMRQALQVTRESVEATALVLSERQQLAMAEGLRYQLDRYLSLAMISGKYRQQAYRELLAWKGATLVRQRQMREVAENVDVAPLFKKLQQTATRLATLSRMTPDPKQNATWRRQITDLTAEKKRLEIELSRESAEFRAAKKRVTLEDMLAALRKDAALVDYFEYWRKMSKQEDEGDAEYVRSLLAFVVRRDTPIVLLDLGPVAPVSASIDTWRRTFGTSRAGFTAANFLRNTLWTPVEKQLEGTKLILVSADGALGRLPLGALPGKKPGTFLLEDYRLAMLPVPQLLPALVAELGRRELGNGERAGGLLLMGDVDYDADPNEAQPNATGPNAKSEQGNRSSTALVRGGSTFSALPGTVGEVATIGDVYRELFNPDASELTTLKQSTATEQAFRDEASNFATLHLATHGFFAAADKKSALAGDANRDERQRLSSERDQMIRGFNPGLLSGLAFSGANRKPKLGQDDGILTADEIAFLPLEHVDLVVLSACETGLGEVAGGEGLIGVQRAFQVAGAGSTVASLWNVGDVATQRLMERFYRNYWQKKMSKLDALREAQLYLLNHPQAVNDENRGLTQKKPQPGAASKRLSPEMWAAFQLSGDWR